MKKHLFTILAVACIAFSGYAQGFKTPAASPNQTLVQDFALSQIKIAYARPAMRGRQIFGGLIPYGEVWRTGANQPTRITFGEEVLFEGKAVPAGEYALYTIPGKKEWTIILSKNTKLWGAFGYQQSDDLLRVNVKPIALSQKVESFTIDLANVAPSSCQLQLSWEKVLVSINIRANIDEKIMTAIDGAMQGSGNKPYYQAAAYYFDNGKDTNKALEWANEAENANPNAYWISHLKAKIQLKLGQKEAAIATAKQSLEMAKKENNADYVRLNEKLIAEAKK